MKTKSTVLAFFVVLGLLTSCDHDSIRASAEVTSVDYSFSKYSAIEVSDDFNVFVSFSDTEESIRIDANANLHDKIVVQQQGNVLTIGLKKSTNIRGSVTTNAFIVTKGISTFDLSGDSSLTLENEWIVSDGKIDLSEDSNFTGEVNAERLDLNSTGDSRCDLYGNAVSLTAKLKGDSDMRDYDLSVENLKIELSGDSDAFLQVNKTIDVTASGDSTLNYKGDAEINTQKLTGDSEVKKRD